MYLGWCVTKAYLLRANSSSSPGESERGLVVVGLDMGRIIFLVWRCGVHGPEKRTLSVFRNKSEFGCYPGAGMVSLESITLSCSTILIEAFSDSSLSISNVSPNGPGAL